MLTKLNNDDNNSEQPCSINIAFSCFNNCEQPLLLHQCWTTLLKQQWSTLFSHDNNVVTALFNHQYCYNLLTRLSNDDNNNKQACSINIVSSCLNNIVETIVNNIVRWTTLLKQHWTTLFVEQHCSAMITVLLRNYSTNNDGTT